MELARRLVEVDDHERGALLRDKSDLVDTSLAHHLKDICLDGWSSNPAVALAASSVLETLTKLIKDPEVEALRKWTHGLELLIKGDMEGAIEALDASERTFLSINKLKLAASTQVSKLIALAMLGRYDEAVECGLRSRKVFEAEADFLTLGKIEHNIGNIYFRRDLYQDAEEFQRSARKHFEQANDLIQLAKIENSLALTLSQQHKTKVAEELYETALARAESVGLKSTQAEIESSIGTLALYQGRYDRALDYLERSRRKYAELNMPHVLAMTEQEIADAYLELNLVPEATEIYERVVEQFARLGMVAEEARALAYQGRAAIESGDVTRAQQLLSESRRLYIKEGNEVGAAVVELTEAQLAYETNDFVSTEAEAEHAGIVLSNAGNPRRVAFARWLQGEAARANGDSEHAKQLLEAALEVARSTEQPDIVAKSLSSLAFIAVERNDVAKAEAQFSSAIEVIEKLRAPLPGEEFRNAFFSDKLLPYNELVKLNLRSDRVQEALRLVEKARARTLVDMIGGSLSAGLHAENDFDRVLLEQLEEKRQELSYFYNQLNQLREPLKVSELQQEVREREAAVAELMRQLRHSKKQRVDASEELDLAQLQQSLGNGRALIEFAALEDELLAFVVTSTSVEVLRNLGSLHEVGEEVAKFRFQVDSLRFGSAAIRKHLPVLTTRIQEHLRRMFDKFFQRTLDLCGERDLVIVPVGKLHYLPFQALYDGSKFLIQSRAVSYASSATVLQQCLVNQHKPIKRALLIGVADKSAPQIADEIEQLKALFPESQVFTNAAATLEKLRENCMTADLVHLACHAQFRSDNPQFSALKLADGWLTVNDSYSLQLESELVTLSACETGVNRVAPGEELMGLARGFLTAGSPSVLMSLWMVDDQATQRLMTSFYSQLAQVGSPANALQKVQVRMIEHDPHPFFWSPFVLTGRW